MLVMNADNVNDAWNQAVHRMKDDDNWHRTSPRGRETMEYDMPVATVYHRPWRRVLFNELRDANPFFHLMEALWMLRGRADANWISQFSKNIAQFAEEDGYFHGAYGHRWLRAFGFDQLAVLAGVFEDDIHTRRAVLAMWDPRMDLRESKRDLPCNTHVYFKVRNGKMNMTVCCRSNDIIWGCYGANSVHFSVLQEFVAAMVGVDIGTYTHVSDSWHFYTDNPTWKKIEAGGAIGEGDNYYRGVGYTPQRLDSLSIIQTDIATWRDDLYKFFLKSWDDPVQYEDPFFSGTAYPMRDAWRNYKRGDLKTAITVANMIRAPDWRVACTKWLERRVK